MSWLAFARTVDTFPAPPGLPSLTREVMNIDTAPILMLQPSERTDRVTGGSLDPQMSATAKARLTTNCSREARSAQSFFFVSSMFSIRFAQMDEVDRLRRATMVSTDHCFEELVRDDAGGLVKSIWTEYRFA